MATKKQGEVKTDAALGVSAETKKQLVAYAPFEFKGQAYRVGDVFVAPAGVERDPAFDELRRVEKRRGNDGEFGLAFVEQGGWVDKQKTERNVDRHILPVKEA